MRRPVTRVRYDESTSNDLLHAYLFGGPFSPGTPPRGISSQTIYKFLSNELKVSASSDTYLKTLALVRFYELDATLELLNRALAWSGAGTEPTDKSCYILQAAGDLGVSRAVEESAASLDTLIAQTSAFVPSIQNILDTHITLVPIHSLRTLTRRIDSEIGAAAPNQHRDLAGRLAYDKVVGIKANALPYADALAKKKVSILGLPSTQRTQDLVDVYLGQSTASGQLIETWAGRMLRREAFEGDPGPVFSALEQAMDAAEKAALPSNQLDFVVCRAADAIIYLGGSLSAHHAQLNAKVEARTANFLWDDP